MDEVSFRTAPFHSYFRSYVFTPVHAPVVRAGKVQSLTSRARSIFRQGIDCFHVLFVDEQPQPDVIDRQVLSICTRSHPSL